MKHGGPRNQSLHLVQVHGLQEIRARGEVAVESPDADLGPPGYFLHGNFRAFLRKQLVRNVKQPLVVSAGIGAEGPFFLLTVPGCVSTHVTSIRFFFVDVDYRRDPPYIRSINGACLRITMVAAEVSTVSSNAQIRSSSPGVVLAIILASYLMIGVDISIVNIALPSLKNGLGFSTVGLSWVVNAYMLAYGGLLFLGGRSGDIAGRRRTLLGGIALFTLASALGGFAATVWWLLAARVLQGIGAALIAPSTLALLITNFPGGAAAQPRAQHLFCIREPGDHHRPHDGRAADGMAVLAVGVLCECSRRRGAGPGNTGIAQGDGPPGGQV